MPLIHSLGLGILAALLAVIQVLGWLALGSFLTRRAEDNEVGVLVSLLVGSGVTGAVLALLSAAGHVAGAVTADALLVLGTLALRGLPPAAWKHDRGPVRAIAAFTG